MILIAYLGAAVRRVWLAAVVRVANLTLLVCCVLPAPAQAEVLPQGKFDLVRRLQKEGHVVAFIGYCRKSSNHFGFS